MPKRSKPLAFWLAIGLIIFQISLIAFGQRPALGAPAPEGITVSPLRSRPNLQPGETSAGTLTVKNQTATTQKLSLSVERFGVTNEAYDYKFLDVGQQDWVRFTDKTIDIEPGATEVVPYQIAIPLTAAPGGYYFALIVATTPSPDTPSIKEIRRVASLVYLEVSGTVKRQGRLLGIDIPWWNSSPTLPVRARVANQGASHQDTRVLIEVKPLLALGSSSQLVLQGLTLPGTVRLLTGNLQLPGVPGIYRVTSSYSPPQGGTEVIRNVVVYVPPWLIVGLSLVAVLGFLLGMHSHYRRRTKKSVKEKSPESSN